MDATISETNLWRSVKKFWTEGLPGKTIHFDYIISYAKDTINQWMSVEIDGIKLGTMSQAFMNIYIFGRRDREGDNLISLRDEVIDLLDTNDCKISLYDTSTSPWTKAGGITVQILSEGKPRPIPDNTKMKTIPTIIRWGAIW